MFGGGAGGATATAAALHKGMKRRFTSSYSLLVGHDVDALEEKFSETLDAEVTWLGLGKYTGLVLCS